MKKTKLTTRKPIRKARVARYHKKYIVGIGITLLVLIGLPLLATFSPQINNFFSKASTQAPTYPTTPPAQICSNNSILGNGPAAAPAGAVTIPAGDNSGTVIAQPYTMQPNTTYWFAPGVHNLGSGEYNQIQPANGDTFIGAPGAILDGQGVNRYAFTGHATGVTIKYLTIQNFNSPQDEGVVNHDSGNNWTMQYNTITLNHGAGVLLGSNNLVSYNCLSNNGQYGFQVIGSLGTNATNSTLDHNEISGNDSDNLEVTHPGCGCTGGGKFWAAQNITVTNNYVHDNLSQGLWADTNNVGFDVENNYISNNFGVGFMYEVSYNAIVKNNNFIHNNIGGGKSNPGFPESAIYLSESGGDSRVPGISSGSLTVTGNNFENNWGGVVIYENSNRYCSSSANTSTGYCTLVNPSVANLTNCANASLLATTPYINDCRWKTQNVSVTNNTFNFTPSAVDPSCTSSNGCGFNGIISTYGTYSPYTFTYVPNNIMWNQNNVFANNTYTGPWQFQAWNQGNVVSWTQWSGNVANGDKCLGSGEQQSGACTGPFGQDAGSTFNGDTTTPAPTTVPGSPTNTPVPTSPIIPTTMPTSSSGPTVPQNLHTTKVTSTSVGLAWGSSTDPAAPVTGYAIIRNGVQIATTADTFMTDTTVTAGQTYTYAVYAYSDGDNFAHSPQSASITVTVGNQASSGLSIPKNFRVTKVTSKSVTLSWGSSTDPVAPVTGYALIRNGVQIATTSNTSVIDKTVVSGQTYTYAVYAYSDGDNFAHSPQSALITVKIP